MLNATDELEKIIMSLMLKDAKNRDVAPLSGSPAKSGPLDFATRQSFPLFFVHEKGLVHMFKKCHNYFPILYFCVATS